MVGWKRTIDGFIEFFEFRAFVEWGKMPQKAPFCSKSVPRRNNEIAI